VKRLFRPVLAFAVASLLYSCANIAPPKGGNKDEKKPKLSKTFPKNGSTNFKGKEVKLVFSEWIEENSLKEQLIITPQVKEYETKIVKNTLTLKFDTSSLKKNTTYYFNFREGIKDITEGNKADSTTLVFSTGPYIDSLEVSGNVVKALENKAEKNVSVGLYDVTDTFDIVKATPVYQTKTEKNGDFRIQNIKPGNYFLYAILDENNSNKYEANKEYIAYLSDELSLTSSLSGINLFLVKEDHERTKVKYKENKKKAVPQLEFNKELKRLEIRVLKGNLGSIFPLINNNKAFLFPGISITDSTILRLISEDAIYNAGADTVSFVFNYVDTTKCSLSANVSNGSEIEPTQEIKIQLSKPFRNFNPVLSIKSAKMEYKNSDYNKIAEIVEDKLRSIITIKPITNWKDTVEILVFPTSFEPVSGYLKDTLKLKYTLKSMEKYGSVGGTVNGSTNNIIVQLLSKDGSMLKEVFNKRDFLFEYLKDGEYKIRVVEDKNQNKRWDQGDYRKRRSFDGYTIRTPLEPIHHYPDVIKLKSNWEILDVKINF
jgi:uncharacterized protein (DUF2141 family)